MLFSRLRDLLFQFAHLSAWKSFLGLLGCLYLWRRFWSRLSLSVPDQVDPPGGRFCPNWVVLPGDWGVSREKVISREANR